MKKFLIAFLIVLVAGGVGWAEGISKPLCTNESGSPSVFTFGSITITTPNNNSTTAACADCVDEIEIKDLPAGAIVEGRAIISEVFTNATTGANVCGASGPRYSYLPSSTEKFWTPDRNVLQVVPLSCTGPGICTFTFDYPPADEWRSPELHVDFQITIYYENNGIPGYQQYTSDVAIVGPYFGGTGGWDPICGSTGCTLGYWKNHDFPVGIYPNSLVDTVFGITNGVNAGLTLIQALKLGGGGEKAMLRQAVAAYLSSIDPGPGWCYEKTVSTSCTVGGCAFCFIGFPYNSNTVKTMVQNAYPNNFEAIKNNFAAANETQCALDDYPRWFGPCCTDLYRFCSWWIENSVP